MSHQFASYWDRGERNVPDMTGARLLLEANDLPILAESLGFTLPLVDVLDVGCGTGRIAKHCVDYHGVDIAQSAVDYCRHRGLRADLIHSVTDLPDDTYGFITAMSVFTHIDRPERQAYLAEFAKRAPFIMVDIIAGDGSGDVAMWTAVPSEMEDDVRSAGFSILAQKELQWANFHKHLFYFAERL